MNFPPLYRNFTFSQALPDGLVCLATNQVAGRGRGRNSWVSQLGALQFSLLVRHSLQLTKAPVVFIQYIIALSILESIRSRKGYEDIPLRLKWPNDIYAETPEGLKKVGGLLVNSSFAQNEFVLVIGKLTESTCPPKIFLTWFVVRLRRQFIQPAADRVYQ